MPDADQLTPSVAFFHLAVDQVRGHLPPAHSPPSTTSCEPVPKMSREGIEVEIEPVTGEEREAARSQELSQGVDEQVRHVLRAGTQMEHRQNLGARVDS